MNDLELAKKQLLTNVVSGIFPTGELDVNVNGEWKSFKTTWNNGKVKISLDGSEKTFELAFIETA